MSVYWEQRAQYHIAPQARAISLTMAAKAILKAQALLIVTGAGMGVDSGVPDFRGSQSFWKNLDHPEIKCYEDMSDVSWFHKDPLLAWGLNSHQMTAYRQAALHQGFPVLLELTRFLPNYFCWTTNIDGMLQRAGLEHVRENHGSIHRLQCLRGYQCKNSENRGDAWEATLDLPYDAQYRASAALPSCRVCGGLARPNVWFCKDSGYIPWSESCRMGDKYAEWRGRLTSDLVVIEMGAGLTIPSARVEAEDMAESHGTLIRINPTDCRIPRGAIGIKAGAEEGLLALRAEVRRLRRLLPKLAKPFAHTK
eukprot:NODE_3270_length_999_cov_53.560780_g3124_i0.p1 GENE.NODE_3270_length_999_cov_53.560780_g3124_i0~~NODE_3270_length_999_cov_53.560780_g3124_i0.p1  ORF type:complete len:309 (+),score=42.22 NODE_3270_length_999_cov_53.560780_g3124_i0:30-956(+)